MSPTSISDFLVIGGGIAGASAAYHLAQHGTVCVLEKEKVCGHHSTGRSAAMYSEHHGPKIVCDLALASRTFFDQGYGDLMRKPVLSDRGTLFVGQLDEEAELEQMLEQQQRGGDAVLRLVDVKQVSDLVPILKPDNLCGGLYYQGAKEIDVHETHQIWLRGLRRKGIDVNVGQELVSAELKDGAWTVKTRTDTFQTKTIVNAAGAWADEVAKICGVKPVGLVPKRRTVITVAIPDDYRDTHWPFTLFIDQKLYFKSDAGSLLVSPMDETPMDPMDAWADDMDMAETADRLEKRTHIKVTKLISNWAGLRSFVADGVPVVGRAPDQDNFFWLAGQGGYGIKTCDAMGRLTAALLIKNDVPEDFKAIGIEAEDLSPNRLA